MELWIPVLTIVGIYTLAVMSPGPNFLVISRNALAHSRRVGQQTALGVASGSVLWIVFGFFGVATIFSQRPILFTLVKTLGAGYLLYTALKMIWAQFNKPNATGKSLSPRQASNSHNGWAFRHGLLTRLSNPKAAVFILALFSSAISPLTPAGMKLILALTMISISFSWYLLVATVLSGAGFQTAYSRCQRLVNLLFAGLLLYLAAYVLISG